MLIKNGVHLMLSKVTRKFFSGGDLGAIYNRFTPMSKEERLLSYKDRLNEFYAKEGISESDALTREAKGWQARDELGLPKPH